MSKTIMEEKLTEAINKKQQDINSFIWKGSKELDITGKYKQSENQVTTLAPTQDKKTTETQSLSENLEQSTDTDTSKQK